MNASPPPVAPRTTNVTAVRLGRQLGVPWDHPAAMYVASLGSGSRRSQLGALNRIAKLLGTAVRDVAWAKLTIAQTSTVRSILAERYKPNTANCTLAALRGTLRWAVKLGQMEREAFAQAVDFAPIRGTREVRGRALSADELRTLFEACSKQGGVLGLRDAAVFGLLYGAGLRRAELVSLKLDSVRAGGAELLVGGKGSKDRVVPLPAGSQRALKRWLRERGDEPGALFLSVVPYRGQLSGHPLTINGLYNVVQEAAERAGIERFSPHDLRRTYIGDLLDEGVDSFTVAKLVGHATPSTTLRYDRRPARARRDAVAKLRVPVPETSAA